VCFRDSGGQLWASWKTVASPRSLQQQSCARQRPLSMRNGAVMTDAYGSLYHAMPGGLPARLRIEGIGAAAEQSRFLARMARPAVTDMTS